MRRLVIILATWWGTGYSPVAPGTVGTIAAIPLFLLLSLLPLYGYICGVLVIGLAASWLAGRAEQIFGEQDNQRIVIDEVMGLLVTMAAVPLTWQYLLAGVVLFRIFDVLKPPPIRLIERTVKGGYGVVFDDVLAGIYAQISLRIVLYVFFTL
jgi:phosphatidylglycerophosphatase A